jgi:hypothetical protein
MSRIKDYFMERMETDPEFREAVELAELRLAEPDYPNPNGEYPALEAGELPDCGERLAA